MKDIEKWAEEYCKEKQITYEALQLNALKLYKNYTENDENIYNYMLSDEFKIAISKMYKVINKNQELWQLKIVKERDEKSFYINQLKNANKDLKEAILDQRYELVKIYYKGQVSAHALLSYEEEKGEFGRYVFLHRIDFAGKDFEKYYGNIAQKLLKFVEKKSFSYLDRIIRNIEKNQIEENGYFILWENSEVIIDLSKNSRGKVEYQYINIEEIEELYVPVFRSRPVRFDKDIGKKYKMVTNYGTFCVCINQKKENASIKIYVESVNLETEYAFEMYTVLIDFLLSLDIKKVYTLVWKEHMMILNKITQSTILNNIFWIRKTEIF